ncbi:GTP-binding protein rhoA [Aspergillus lentulus]|uniref:GTP-binding protein rhoA n=1 Tax=Aspergillus lentulus TaxID=293939 RepID=A0ABQ1ALA3_ASPLE|nr:GTP-binding protein rhoA [Aspergillus lentulus]GFF31113.1 GTP-binding protein rhoA [Aspergillus lentulus]GFF66102.1 GTP-binding protein rhoA [Aspergillus lentulus]GFF82286.1 GTP-binding protein rhoA [Aspergillus lentulus]GFF85843.1 GTP-binding protein rhoA [Aspergillus lentulus]
MVEPLTIIASAASLLGICSKVAVELKKFRHGAAEARTYVTAMLNDMKGLRDVLQSMEDTFDELEVQPPSGHIGIHWKNLLRSLQDGRSTLEQLEELLTTINKQVTFLDSARREVRVKSAVEQIVNFRQQVQTYKDAMQLSLQTIIFWHQVSIQESTSKILPSLNAMHSDIRRLATNLDIKLHGLQNMFNGSNQQKQMAGVENLKEFIHSAATVLSSASTITSNDKEGDDALSEYADDFWPDFNADWFRTKTNLDWVSSTRGKSLTFELGNTSFQEPLTTSSDAPGGLPEVSPSPTQPLIHLTRKGSGHWFDRLIPSSRERQPTVFNLGTQNSDHYQLKDETVGIEKPAEDSYLSRPVPPSLSTPAHQQSKTSKQNLTPLFAFPSREKRQSLIQLFWSKASANKRSTPKARRELAVTEDQGHKQSRTRMKFVFVGDGACGKTCLLIRASKGVMPEVYVPTVFENYVCDVQAYGTSVEVALWDTAGQEDYDRLRPLAYPDSHGVFICFSIDSPDSLYNAQEKVKYSVRQGRGEAPVLIAITQWINEVSHFCKDVPVFLLGCKNDLRDDPSTIGELFKTSQCPVKPAVAEEVGRDLGAVEYFDCSAKTGDGVDVALEKAVRHVLQGEMVQKKRRKGRSFF